MRLVSIFIEYEPLALSSPSPHPSAVARALALVTTTRSSGSCAREAFAHRVR